jgi:sodium/hydrogen exchanger-like protein 6/7
MNGAVSIYYGHQSVSISNNLANRTYQVAGGVLQPTYLVILRAIGEFLGIFSASFLVGSLMACLTAILTKFTHIRNHPQLETTLFVLMSYSTFLLSEVLNLTGIVAVLFCGICQAHYTYNNLSPESRAITRNFFDQLNFMAENFIFSYIGVSMFTFPNHRFDPGFIFAAFVAIIVGRALNVYPISFLLNLGRKTKITMNLQHMMFLTGLRGAIAFALSIRNTLTVSRQMILTTTLLIVIVTVIFCGGSAVTLLTWLGIPLGVDDDEREPISSPAHR